MSARPSGQPPSVGRKSATRPRDQVRRPTSPPCNHYHIATPRALREREIATFPFGSLAAAHSCNSLMYRRSTESHSPMLNSGAGVAA